MALDMPVPYFCACVAKQFNKKMAHSMHAPYFDACTAKYK